MRRLGIFFVFIAFATMLPSAASVAVSARTWMPGVVTSTFKLIALVHRELDRLKDYPNPIPLSEEFLEKLRKQKPKMGAVVTVKEMRDWLKSGELQLSDEDWKKLLGALGRLGTPAEGVDADTSLLSDELKAKLDEIKGAASSDTNELLLSKPLLNTLFGDKAPQSGVLNELERKLAESAAETSSNDVGSDATAESTSRPFSHLAPKDWNELFGSLALHLGMPHSTKPLSESEGEAIANASVSDWAASLMPNLSGRARSASLSRSPEQENNSAGGSSGFSGASSFSGGSASPGFSPYRNLSPGRQFQGRRGDSFSEIALSQAQPPLAGFRRRYRGGAIMNWVPSPGYQRDFTPPMNEGMRDGDISTIIQVTYPNAQSPDGRRVEWGNCRATAVDQKGDTTVLVTAAHCITNPAGNGRAYLPSQLKIWPGCQVNGNEAQFQVHANSDVAVMSVKNACVAQAVTTGQIPVIPIASKALDAGESVRIDGREVLNAQILANDGRSTAGAEVNVTGLQFANVDPRRPDVGIFKGDSGSAAAREVNGRLELTGVTSAVNAHDQRNGFLAGTLQNELDWMREASEDFIADAQFPLAHRTGSQRQFSPGSTHSGS